MLRVAVVLMGWRMCGDGVKWPCARAGQGAFLFGKRGRESAGASSRVEAEGASGERRLTRRDLKRDAKRWRKVMAKLEVMCRTGGASEAEVVAIRG